MPTSRFFEFGSTLKEGTRDELNHPHGGDPVAVCIRVEGDTPQEAVANVLALLFDALDGDGPIVEDGPYTRSSPPSEAWSIPSVPSSSCWVCGSTSSSP